MSRWVAVMGLSCIMFLLTCFGCAGQSGEVKLGHALAIGGATLGCAENEAPLVYDAIKNGSADWLAIAFEGIGCLPGVIRSIIDAASPRTASLEDARPVSKRAMRRALFALRMYRLLKPGVAE